MLPPSHFCLELYSTYWDFNYVLYATPFSSLVEKSPGGSLGWSREHLKNLEHLCGHTPEHLNNCGFSFVVRVGLMVQPVYERRGCTM